jgi:salicylate hydroxylase
LRCLHYHESASLTIYFHRIGENRHVMTYTIAAGESFNMVLSHIDRSDPATWTGKFTNEAIQHEFRGWDSQYVINLR